MKPACQFDAQPRRAGAEVRAAKRQFPRTAYFFQSGIGEWRGYWSPYDGERGSESRNFRSLSGQFLTEAAREHAKEMAVFGLVALTSAWPVIYMVITVVRLLGKGRP
jgi:hypothetical protein